MTLFVVRHGRTEANASGLLLGRADPQLDDVGWQQASDMASVLPTGARVVSSPLRRCTETASVIADRGEPGVPVETDDRLVELDYGELDLRPLAEVPAATWAQWRSDPDFRPPGGETLNELASRVGASLEELVTDDTTRDVVVVTHVSPVKAALAWALGVGIGISWRSFVAQASITRIAVGERGPSLHTFNSVAHLEASA
jgi:broad specificity phosphatase PhoE